MATTPLGPAMIPSKSGEAPAVADRVSSSDTGFGGDPNGSFPHGPASLTTGGAGRAASAAETCPGVHQTSKAAHAIPGANRSA
jgi:hypothetical protein